jgi:hypothetical protein
MTWEGWFADEAAPAVDPVLEEIRKRLELDKAEFTVYGQYDQTIRDREYLLSLIEGGK